MLQAPGGVVKDDGTEQAELVQIEFQTAQLCLNFSTMVELRPESLASLFFSAPCLPC
jgi:hypothetical protein